MHECLPNDHHRWLLLLSVGFHVSVHLLHLKRLAWSDSHIAYFGTFYGRMFRLRKRVSSTTDNNNHFLMDLLSLRSICVFMSGASG